MTHRQLQLQLHASKERQPLSSLVGLLFFCAAAGLAHSSVQAQTLYRIVGPDGRVTFSDKPPAAAAKVTPLSAEGKESGTSGAALPYELRQVAAKYPVTLFTSTECMPCDEGRTLLRSRGIPFSEKTINSNDDADSLKRLADTTSLPLLTVGSQQIKGYSAPEWTQYLNAAGYPERSKLPASYRYAEPSPLVAAKPAESASGPAKVPDARAQTNTPPPQPASRVSPNNPAGIQF